MGKKKQQIRTVLMIELCLISACSILALSFWHSMCSDLYLSCLADQQLGWAKYIVLSVIRPALFTPQSLYVMLAGRSFGVVWGTILGTIAACVSTLFLFLPAKLLGQRVVGPWLVTNLPHTYRFIRSQDWKLVLAIRLIPIAPFDLFSLLFGIVNFHSKRVLLFTFVGQIPSNIAFAYMATQQAGWIDSIGMSLGIASLCWLLPGLFFEYKSRRKGTSLWQRAKAMWLEINDEVRHNNDIVRRYERNPQKIPILLLYGYFSSRRALTVMERLLSMKGYEVFSFNLGGLLGVFFTESIDETADYLDIKLRRYFSKHPDVDKVRIVAHSKGGMVATQWLLKYGGHRYCDKLITLGTPFAGSWLAWLALITPMGLIFRDVWQMRIGSKMLKEFREKPLPKDLQIYNFYSRRDWVAHGEGAILRPDKNDQNIIPIPMHHVSHFEFLYRRDVANAIADALGPCTKQS
ncbi:MAG: VTT domain-containing protein [Zetaproteobacteria bacterium]|nr:VTT domain-containing protein [Zetaproteobacteria bacterium]